MIRYTQIAIINLTIRIITWEDRLIVGRDTIIIRIMIKKCIINSTILITQIISIKMNNLLFRLKSTMNINQFPG